MKHYTYEEHHTFCVESGISNSTIWNEVVRLGWLPEGIYHNPGNAFNPKQKEYQHLKSRRPERKAYQKEYNKKYTSTPEYKARRKKYRSTPEHKANRKEWNKRRYLRNKK